MALHKGILGQTEGGASTKTDAGSFDRYPYMKHSTANPDEMIRTECCGNPFRTGPHGRGCPNCPPRKLTFDEWWALEGRRFMGDNNYVYHQTTWQAAQENK